MQVDIKKKYRTRSGLEVTDLRLASYNYAFPVRGIVKRGKETLRKSWTLEGRWGAVGETDWDLIEVVEVSPESTDVSMEKQYQTKGGRKVRIYCTDANSPYPVHGAVWREEEGGYWGVCIWTKKGSVYTNRAHPDDLVEIKPRIQREYWANIRPNNVPTLHLTRQKANQAAESDRIDCVKVVIDCAEGAGLTSVNLEQERTTE